MEAAAGGLIGLLIVVILGAVVGWLASLIVKGSGSGLLFDILIGIAGAFFAGWLLPAMGVPLPGSQIGSFVAAVVGAVALLLILRVIRRA
jgi:uncharacterized membrane protein YeaQ/YmgE (transglycosylase-associated protein family)